MAQTKLQRLQARLGAAATGQDALLVELLEEAEQGIKFTTHRKTLPAEADTLIVKIAVIDFNRTGTEGQQSKSFSGISDTWIDGYPANIQAEVNGLKIARFL